MSERGTPSEEGSFITIDSEDFPAIIDAITRLFTNAWLLSPVFVVFAFTMTIGLPYYYLWLRSTSSASKKLNELEDKAWKEADIAPSKERIAKWSHQR